MTIPRELLSDYRVWIGIAVGVVFLATKLLNQGTPKEKSFSCTKCRKREDHSQRTIQAWWDGKHRFFCSACHQTWIRTKSSTAPSRGSSGCLSLLIVGLVGFGGVTYVALNLHKIEEPNNKGCSDSGDFVYALS